jgi:hypothetical protein
MMNDHQGRAGVVIHALAARYRAERWASGPLLRGALESSGFTLAGRRVARARASRAAAGVAALVGSAGAVSVLLLHRLA